MSRVGLVNKESFRVLADSIDNCCVVFLSRGFLAIRLPRIHGRSWGESFDNEAQVQIEQSADVGTGTTGSIAQNQTRSIQRAEHFGCLTGAPVILPPKLQVVQPASANGVVNLSAVPWRLPVCQ